MSSILKKLIRKSYNVIRYHWWKMKFASFGKKSILMKPLRIDGPENIIIGKYVGIHKYAWLGAKNLTGFTPKLIIHDRATVGDFSHIFATKKIEIGENVLLANYVYISDNVHGYDDIDKPIVLQPIIQKNEVSIGDDSWIGEHVSIIGCSIGRHCIIGANSVVTRDIPDYCIAVGTPAHIIKRYDFKTNQWRRTENDGTFK